MKAQVFSIDGRALREVKLPECFDAEIRHDIIKRAYESEQGALRQPYGAYPLAGIEVSASGKIKHGRRKYKTSCGYGISRIPRKIMTRRGNRFYWQGAFIPGTRKGRQAHPPKAEKSWLKKINKKEKTLAFRAAIAATASLAEVERKYNKKIEIRLPVVIEERITELKTKQAIEAIKKIFGENYHVFKNKKILLISKKEPKANIFETLNPEDLRKIGMIKLASGCQAGRLVIYTENALVELEKLK